MNETGPERREGFLDAVAVANLRRDPERFDPAAVQALTEELFGPPGQLTFRTLALGPGEGLANLLPEEAAAGFVLDLEPAGWRSEWGGLLLFRGVGGQLHGYRPVPGALTLFRASTQPFLSLITSQGARRTSILGWWPVA